MRAPSLPWSACRLRVARLRPIGREEANQRLGAVRVLDQQRWRIESSWPLDADHARIRDQMVKHATGASVTGPNSDLERTLRGVVDDRSKWQFFRVEPERYLRDINVISHTISDGLDRDP